MSGFNWKILKGTTSGTPNTATQMAPSAATASRVIFRAGQVGQADNSADISIGPDANADYTTIAANQEYDLSGSPSYGGWDLSAWYVKSTAASQKYTILYQ